MLSVELRSWPERRIAIASPQDKGREWEEIWKTKVQGEKVPGSGNQWHSRLDVRGKRITWSNKWTSTRSITLYPYTLDEIVQATDAPGGNGSIPGIAIRLEGLEDYVILRADDFLELMTDKPIIQAEKAAIKRATAQIPELLREID